MVPLVGLEPTRLAALDFESSASTIPPQGHCLFITTDRLLFKPLLCYFMAMKDCIKQLWSCPVAVSAGIALISVIALATAFTAQFALNLPPCILCLYQRIPYAIALVLGVSGLLLRDNTRAIVVIVAISALVFLLNAALAFYHVGVEEKWWRSMVEGCAVPAFDTGAEKSILDQILQAPTVSCDKAAWRDPVLKLSMAGYNVLLCLFVAVNCGIAAIKISEKS